MDSPSLIEIFGIGALILLLLWYRAYVKKNISSLKIKQKKIVGIEFFGRKLAIVPPDIYSTKSTLKLMFSSLLIVIVLMLFSLFLHYIFFK
jgi:hypothetical protein